MFEFCQGHTPSSIVGGFIPGYRINPRRTIINSHLVKRRNHGTKICDYHRRWFRRVSAGIYARLNGFEAHIFELHDKPGGLCTSWKRKGYTIDGCIHWLVGSNPKSGMHRFWEEVGLSQGREFVNAEEYSRYETRDGRTVIFFSDTDRLEVSPA